MTSNTLIDSAHWREDPRNKELQEPIYLTPHDIYDLNPNTKFIVLLRNPVTRIYSKYNMLRWKTKSPENFHIFIRNSVIWWENCTFVLPVRGCLYGSPPEMPSVEPNLSGWWPLSQNYSGTIREGMYYLFLQDWFSIFPRSSFMFVRSEDYTHNQLSVMNEAFNFLGIPTAGDKVVNKIEKMQKAFVLSYKPMLHITKHLLQNFYMEYNQKLADLLGNDKWLWNDSRNAKFQNV